VDESTFISGNISHYTSQWEQIGVSDTVLSWIQNGVPLPLKQDPGSFELQNKYLSPREAAFVDSEIHALCSSGAIVECLSKPKGISPISVAPKKGKGYRLIVDLRHLNQFCTAPKFAYEDINSVLEQVKPNDYLVTADVKSGFHHVPIQKEYQDFLGISWNSRYYIWRVLPFGLNISPYFFCKVVRPVVTYLRTLGIRVVVYVDDLILMAPQALIEVHRDIVLCCLKKLGWFINYEKSSLIPSTVKPFIGYILNTVNSDGNVWISIPAARIRKLRRDITRALSKGCLTARALARIAGQCISMAKAVLPAKLLLRNIYRLLRKRASWQDILPFDSGVISDLEWWYSALLHWNGRAVCQASTPLQMTTDASAIGWGATLLNKQAQGLWNTRLSYKPSNTRELMAILLGLLSFLPDLENKTLQVLTDNISAAAYINFQGGPSEELTQIATAIWDVALSHQITLSAKYLAGSLNLEADALSRLTSPSMWRLNPAVFRYIDKVWGPHTIDRFASLATTQTDLYNSMYWDPHTSGVDALAQDNWSIHNNYVCPPFRMLNRILQTVRDQRAVATVIAPMWPGQTWYGNLLRLSVCHPIRLPHSPKTFLQIGQKVPEPLRNPRWQIYAWRISGCLS